MGTSRWGRAGLAVLVALVLAGGAWLVRVQAESARLEVEKELTAIARLKAEQIADWRDDQLADAGVLMRHPFLIAAITAFLAEPSADRGREVAARLRLLAAQHSYSDILLTDPAGQVRLRLEPGSPTHIDEFAPQLQAALHTRQPAFVDLHHDPADRPPHTTTIAPLFAAADPAARPLGCLLLVSDASRFLFPLLAAWPTPSQSAETLLISRQGGQALLLNDPRDQRGAGLSLRLPLTEVGQVSVMAALGRQGYAQALDYRGTQVAAVILPIKDSPWSLVAKIDQAEAFADWRFRTGLQLALLTLLLALAAVSWLVLRQRQRQAHLQRLYQAEAAAREALEYQALLLRSIGDGVIATDAQGRVNLLNASAERLTGWTTAAARGRALSEVFVLVDGRTSEPAVDPVQQVLATGGVVGLANHTLLVARDGARHHVADSAAPVMDASGRLAGVVLIFRDVSESYRLREAVQRERSILRLFVDEVPAAIAMFDQEMRYLAASRRFLVDYGLGDRDIIGQSHYEIFPDIPERWREAHRRGLRGAVEASEEDSFLRRDGRREWVRWAIHPWREPSGEVGGILLFTEVITARKAAEAALLESEAKFRTLFQQHAAVKLLIDPDDGRIVEANEAAAAYYGWSRDQLRQMRIHDINTLTADQTLAEMARARRQERIFFEFRHRRADGSVRDVAVYSSAIDIQGHTLLHSILHDITDLRQLEDQLRQAQKLESIGRLAGGVAHDFNNMLTVIIGYGQLALEQTAADDPRHAQLAEILRAAHHSAEVTRQLLAFARRQQVRPEVVDLNEVVSGLLRMLGRLIGEHIALVWQPGAAAPPVVMDPSQCHQILVNLCVNARDAIAGHGTITLTTGAARFTADTVASHPWRRPGDYAVLEVRDDGCGMDAAAQARIFEPFYTTKGVNEGTGLGLPMVYGIVHQNGGFLEVASEPGQGATFTIYLPAADRRQAAPPASPVETAPATPGATILLVEDEPSLLQMTRLMLTEMGYGVLATTSPPEALHLAETRADAIDLLITDVVMPQMGGHELADLLRRRIPELRVLFVSGYSTQLGDDHPGPRRRTGFLAKPFRLRDLARAVHQALGRDPEAPSR